MDSVHQDEERRSGFDFSGHTRNAALATRGHAVPRATSTGTTIVGLIYKGGVVLGADTRATEGPIVADKNCEKIHYITEGIRCCGAGTAADTEFVTKLISSNMQLHELHTRKRPRVVTAMTLLKQRLFQYQGQVGAALVLGGYDSTGPQLFTIAPHGSTDKLPYVTMGSGSLAAMSVFESGWRPDMEVGTEAHPGTRSDCVGRRGDRVRDFQRSRLRIERGRVRDPGKGHRDASQLPHAQRTCQERAELYL